MLNPKGHPIALLPEDREIMRLLGVSEAEYRAFVKECAKRSRIEPGTIVNLSGFEIILINLVIGLILSAASALLFRPRLPGRPAEIRQSSDGGQNIVNRTEYAPKAGFDSLQNVVELGSTIPLVYAKRETIDGVTYGGVRVNTNLLWSQMTSLGGSLMLRAVCMISEAEPLEIDPTQFAFGDNVLGAYDLAAANNSSSRATFYVSRNGGRITSADRVAGRSAANDTGNAENAGGGDVFQIRGLNNEWTTDFCYSYKPSTQTQFGVYQLIGNGFGFRVNPQLRPAVVVKTEPSGSENTRIKCDKDGVAGAQRQKYNAQFSSRSGVTAINGTPSTGAVNLNIGDTITYTLSNTSDAKTVFIGQQKGPDHKETCLDVSQTVSGRQRTWDDALVVGDLYKFGSALFVCESRSPDDEIFSSEADYEPIGGGQAVNVTLRCVQAGTAVLNPISSVETATSTSHLFKVAIGSFAMPRAGQVLELGIRSTLGIRINGICNFRDCMSHTEIDGRACEYYEGNTYRPGQSLELSNFQSGSYSGSEERLSFFKVGYRIAGTDDAYIYLTQCFGVRSITQQASFNFLRLQMPSFQRWEFRIEPLTGWEIRQGVATGTLEVLDSRISGYRIVASGEVTASFSGEPVDRSQATFQMAATRDRNLGVTLSDAGDYADAWGKLAEDFVYEEIQSSANNPEHELVYVNLLAPNATTPNYTDIALVGLNLRASTEFTQLNQLSIYVNQGIANGVHTFPEVLKDLLTNSRYGAGSILSPLQVDDAGFSECTTWTRGRRYFFDGALTAPLNIRQWGSQTATYFLLDFVIRNGKFSLQPSFYFDRPEPITSFYSAGNILEDSFELAYVEASQRIPRRVSVKWRQEKASTDAGNKGLFPVIREVTVREAGTPDTAPLEGPIDLSDFCTSEAHAIDVAKSFCRTFRLITHSVRFKTTPNKAAFEAGRCFLLGLETVAYLQPNNGAIDSNGVITTTTPLADGTYTVLLWTGTGSEVIETELSVTNGQTSQYQNAAFCLKQSSVEKRAYKVQSLGMDEDGNVQVDALYFPLQDNGYSAMVEGWDVESNWIIEGRIGTSEETGAADPAFEGVSIIGPGTVTTDVASTYTALVSGGAGAYSYQWSGTGITFGNTTSASTSVTSTSDGSKTITCAVTLDESTRSASKTITSVAAAVAETLGTVTLNGSLTTSVGVATPYSISISGNATSIFYAWNTDPVTSVISASDEISTDITFLAAGTYTVSCLVSALNASDSPQTVTTTVTVT